MSFLVWLYLAHRVGSRLEAVSSTRFFRGIQAVRNWAFGVLLVSLITALLKDLIVDAFR
jgi:hypothetical protein